MVKRAANSHFFFLRRSSTSQNVNNDLELGGFCGITQKVDGMGHVRAQWSGLI